MESSRFLQLTDQILVEYIYTDQGDPTVFNTASYPIELMQDGYNGNTYLFNTDSVSDTMGNYRDISAVSITSNDSQFVFLNTSLGVPYNDTDSQLTDTTNLLQTFSPNVDVEYDRIRVHFVSGFSFEDADGLIFELQTQRRDGQLINLSSIIFDRNDTPTFNPDPFLLGENLYATYIEWRVPSLFYMIEGFSKTLPNTLAYKFTDGKGFLSNATIKISIQEIYQTITENSYSFYNVSEKNATTILSRDIYDNLSASIVEAQNADYYEITGLVSGSSLSNFIAELNTTNGGDWVVVHQIIVSEQIGTTYIQTSDQMFTQTDDFDEPILFRPIIKNSAIAVSFAINYTLRLYNRSDNTQIIKNARLVSFDPKKYGRRLRKLNLGTVPTILNVYNELADDSGQQIVYSDSISVRGQSDNEIESKVIIKKEYITSFRDRINIKVSASPIKIQNIQNPDG